MAEKAEKALFFIIHYMMKKHTWYAHMYKNMMLEKSAFSALTALNDPAADELTMWKQNTLRAA